MSHQSNLEIKKSIPIHLKPWQEIVGIFREISIDNYFTYVKIDDNTLTFPVESQESEKLRNVLSGELVGKRIGIIRCDEPLGFLIRVCERSQN